ERAVLHRIRNQAFHLSKLSSRRRTIVVTDHVFAHLRRADEGAEVYACALLVEPFKILVERAPIHRQVEATIEIFLLFQNAIVDRRYRFTFAGNLSRHAHHDLAHRAWIDQNVLFRLAEHVDEARRNDLSTRVDFALGFHAAKIAHLDNSIVFDRNVVIKGRLAGAVDDAPVTNDEVVWCGCRHASTRHDDGGEQNSKQKSRDKNFHRTTSGDIGNRAA